MEELALEISWTVVYLPNYRGGKRMGKDPKTIEVAGMKVGNLNEPSRGLCHLF